ncbi:MAG: hypothetical protein ACP5CD_07105 [Thermovirgaceae bacterium]
MKSFLLSGIIRSDKVFVAESIAIWDEMTLTRQTFKQLIGKTAKIEDLDDSKVQGKFLKEHLGEPLSEFEKNSTLKFSRKIREINEYPEYVPHWLLLRRMLDLYSLPFPDEKVTLPEMDRLCLKVEGLFLKDFAKAEKIQTPPDILEFLDIYAKQMAEAFVENFSKLSRANQDKALDDMLQKIKDLPEEQKEAFRSSLKLEEITKDSLRKAILAGGASISLPSFVGMAGFGAYILLAQMLAAIGALFGLTLPFGIYTFAASLLAVLSNPLTMALFLAGGGLLIDNKSRTRMQKELLKGLMAQMVFISRTKDGSWKDTKKFLEAREALEYMPGRKVKLLGEGKSLC